MTGTRTFWHNPDKISAEEMRLFAAKLLNKPSCDVTLREASAALPALRLHRHGAPGAKVVAVYRETLGRIIE